MTDVTKLRKKEDVIDENGNTVKNVNGGKKWAYLYYHQITWKDYIEGIITQCQYTDFTHSTVLHALWAEPLGYALLEDVATMKNGLRNYFKAIIDILLDERKATAAGIYPNNQDQTRVNKFTDEQKAQMLMTLYPGVTAFVEASAPLVKRGFSWILTGVRRAINRGNAENIAEDIIELVPRAGQPAAGIPPRAAGDAPQPVPAAGKRPQSNEVKEMTELTFLQVAYVFYGSRDPWGHTNDLGHVDRGILVTFGLQTLSTFTLPAHSSAKVYYGWGKFPAQQAAAAMEADRQAAGRIANASVERVVAMNSHLEAVAANPGAAQRANAANANELAQAAHQPANASEAMPSSKGPRPNHHQKKKSPSEGPIQKWFREKGRPFFDKLDVPPPPHFNWTPSTTKVEVGKDTTLTIKGTPYDGHRNKLTKNFYSVRINFISNKSLSSTLFESEKRSEEKSEQSSSRFFSKTAQWQASIEHKDRGNLRTLYKGFIPYIDIAPGRAKIAVMVRGKIAKMWDRKGGAEQGDGRIPPWAKYTIMM
ncbi:hypothetical protein M501DRAFT_992199 [Patellaria atrata CBS 101060]|uniref:Uncharacterized protein n=1 Tax=Patellaria atrata CBS 101060 TaxID=1346257 RepID=A0A9P4SAS1_9PEZI|nr:hypothetical protein M501DRAFT_992199 [Patellaria atrata CBS 101060]